MLSGSYCQANFIFCSCIIKLSIFSLLGHLVTSSMWMKMSVRMSRTHTLYLLVGAVASLCLVYDVVPVPMNRMYYTGITQVLYTVVSWLPVPLVQQVTGSVMTTTVNITRYIQATTFVHM